MNFARDPKRLLATLIGGVAGVFVLLDFSGAVPVIDAVALTIINWAAVVSALALLVGLLSVAGSHINRVRHRREDWGYSLVLLVAMAAMVIVGTLVPVNDQLSLPGTIAEQPLRLLFRAVYEPLAGSLLALLAFFSLSAVLRALRSGSTEALVIVAVAAIVLIAQLPPVAALPFVGTSIQWFQEYVALAGARGLLIGVAIGATVASVRVLLGFDQPYLDR
jgi:hypothetical protein